VCSSLLHCVTFAKLVFSFEESLEDLHGVNDDCAFARTVANYDNVREHTANSVQVQGTISDNIEQVQVAVNLNGAKIVQVQGTVDANGAKIVQVQGTVGANGVKNDQVQVTVDANGVKLDEIQAKVDIALDILAFIRCPYETTGLGITFIGQGCDGIDNDCDTPQEGDECDEDQVPPSIRLAAHTVPSKPFQSDAEARSFLSGNLDISDDCVPNPKLQVDIALISMIGIQFSYEVMVTDPRCFSENTPASQSKKTFVLLVDDASPSITCGFFTPQDMFHVLPEAGFDTSTGLLPPFPQDETDPLHIDYCHFGRPLVDVNLWYRIEVSPSTLAGGDAFLSLVLMISLAVYSNFANITPPPLPASL
jgi:hypothetical protein